MTGVESGLPDGRSDLEVGGAEGGNGFAGVSGTKV
ncbi:MAG: hypothetical protein FD176_3544, partial [Rhodospirillaceae bacterium]